MVDALRMPVNLEVVSTTESSVLRLRQYLETGDRPITHLIAIERVAPASDGKPHRERGWDMTRETAPLHLLFDDPAATRRWYTIGIGDGGNEIGMGSLPKEIIESGIPNGEVIAATTLQDGILHRPGQQLPCSRRNAQQQAARGGRYMPIKGLDALHRTLDDAKRALAALEGQFGSVRFVPSDAESVQGAIASLEAMIDEKLLPFRGNAIVESLIPQLKEKYRAGILERVEEAIG